MHCTICWLRHSICIRGCQLHVCSAFTGFFERRSGFCAERWLEWRQDRRGASKVRHCSSVDVPFHFPYPIVHDTPWTYGRERGLIGHERVVAVGVECVVWWGREWRS